MGDILDDLEDEVAGLYGDGVAVDPDNEEEEALVVFKEEGKVGSINHSVLHNHEYRF